MLKRFVRLMFYLAILGSCLFYGVIPYAVDIYRNLLNHVFEFSLVIVAGLVMLFMRAFDIR